MVPQRYFTKSQAAFIMSVDRLFSLRKKVYFWTFTFKQVYHEWEYPTLWHSFIRGMELAHGTGRQGACIRGLRVLEPHERHGLHYHMLTNKRLSVHIVRRVGRRFGMGRVHVEECDRGTGYYLAKYLGKNQKAFCTRRRSWGSVGGFMQCKVKDVEVDSAFSRNMKGLFNGHQVDFKTTSFVLALSRIHGDLALWPKGLEGIVCGKANGTGARKRVIARSGRAYFLNPTIKYRALTPHGEKCFGNVPRQIVPSVDPF